MKKGFFVCIIGFIISFFLFGCVKQVEFKDRDKKTVFAFEDIKNFPMDNYKVKPMRNGKDYFYTKSNTKMNGYSCMYRMVLNGENNNDVKLNTSINLQTSSKKAIQLFDSMAKTNKALYGSGMKDVKPKEYHAKQLLIIETEDYFSVILRKDNLVYWVEIDGLSINEEQVKDKLLKKVDNIIDHKVLD